MQIHDFHHLEDLYAENDFGIYIHVPFCMRRCRYCAFVSSVLRPVPSEAYVKTLCAEFDQRIESFDKCHLTTIYFGGGTPTMLNDSDIAKLLNHILQCCSVPHEITLEANPEHITPERAQCWKSLGMTRISLGVQSFDDRMLAFLGRRHTGTQALQAIEHLTHAGFDEISIDLIYGAKAEDSTPEEDLKQWQKVLETARSIHPAHVSCYELTLEENTPLWTAQKRGTPVLYDENTTVEMMHLIEQTLGMQQYEISNYCRDHYYSRHNLSCWAGLPYLGLGPGAHSLIKADHQIIRQANMHDIRKWLQAFQDHPQIVPEPLFSESLSAQTHLAERLMCAARTRLPWSAQSIASSIHASLTPFIPCLNKAIQRGLISGSVEDSLQTTRLGIDLNNQLDEILFEGEG